MSLTINRSTDQPAIEGELFTMDAQMLETPAARRAWQAGLLVAKLQAMHRAERLVKIGRPLLVAIIFVSFLHIWETIGAIRPEFVQEMRLPSWVYHAAAAALTLAIDAAALYVVAADGTAALAGATRRRGATWFFLATTFLLNAAFVVRYAPSLPEDLRTTVLPGLEILFVVLLPATIPVSIVAIEGSVARLEAARLKLLVETTALRELAQGNAGKRGEKPVKASQSINGPLPALDRESDGPDMDEETAGRKTAYTLADLEEVTERGETIARREIIDRLKCGETTADKLIGEAVGAGILDRLGRGTYQRL